MRMGDVHEYGAIQGAAGAISGLTGNNQNNNGTHLQGGAGALAGTLGNGVAKPGGSHAQGIPGGAPHGITERGDPHEYGETRHPAHIGIRPRPNVICLPWRGQMACGLPQQRGCGMVVTRPRPNIICLP